MKISLDWLSEYVEIDGSAEQIAAILSDLGFPTEGMEICGSDTVIDVEVTSNRGDCLSHIGIARELAAATGKKLKMPEIKFPRADKDVSEFVDVRIDDSQLCGRYTARVIIGVKIGASPDWMKARLEAVGIRSVNNIVDASNYAMMESGQPPHTFDYDKLTGGEIIVRPGVKGERLISIDETKCELDESMLVIADKAGPVAVAGIMGGLDSEISDSATKVLLEDAHFDPVSIRTTGRRLGIASEASFRFERHVDIEMIDWASQRCAQLITQVAGGTVAKGVVDVYPAKWEQQTVGMRISRLNKLIGIEFDRNKVLEIFKGLGFEPQEKKDGLVVCSVPSWRHDIYREADLIEEVARCHGYGKIPVDHKITISVVPVDRREKMVSRLRTFLNGCGFYETINVTFVNDAVGGAFIEDDDASHLSVRDDSRRSANRLRRSLLGSLLSVFKTNYNAGNIPCRIFELANTFKPVMEERGFTLPVERTKLALVFDGEFCEMRGIVEGFAGVINRDLKVDFKGMDVRWAKAGAEIIANGDVVGRAGILSQQVADKFGLENVRPCAAEVDFDVLLSMEGGGFMLKAIPRFPSITRDLSLVVDESTKWSDIINAVDGKKPTELEEVKFAGIYRGEPIPAGKKSVTVSLCFRDDDGTLRHEIVDGFERNILEGLRQTLNVQLRTV